MKRKYITVEKLFNLGNYENLSIKVKYEISEGDYTTDIIEKLKQEMKILIIPIKEALK